MLIAFLFGLVALLAWLYATGAERWALRLLWIGLLYGLFASLLNAAAGIARVLVVGEVNDWWFGVEAILIVPIIEELVKSHAARSQSIAVHSFALVCLFGIFELMISKPVTVSAPLGWPAFIEALDTLPALTMHILTAAIYSFFLTANRVSQIAICAIIHAAFNGLWIAEFFHLLPIASVVAILMAAWLFNSKDKRSSGQLM